MITDEQLRDHLAATIEASLVRFETKFPQAVQQLRTAVTLEYMAGMGQLATWLTDNDGLTSPAQIQRVLAGIAKEIGIQRTAHDTASN